jgi:hypothetical protein
MALLSKKSKQKLSEIWSTTKRGYSSTVRAGQKYFPRAERAFGTMAKQATEAFAINPGKNEVDLSIKPVPRMGNRGRYLDLRPRRKRQDFGSLTFNI